jgi:hypothetical protein
MDFLINKSSGHIFFKAKKKKKNKVAVVMGEFKRGTLRSGSGAKVKKRSQAVAIAMKEAGLSKQ